MRQGKGWVVALTTCALIAGLGMMCGDEKSPTPEKEKSYVRIKNAFNDTTLSRRPPWTVAKCSYRGVEFGKILLGDSSALMEVDPGLDYVLLVAAWSDTSCSTTNCLPLASANEEEVVEGQTRTIVLNANNHCGPCPPTGVEPISETPYNRVLALYPAYGFLPYADRANNPQCQ
jgi:hypothetical protein